MKTVTKITFTDDNGIKFFGEGPLRLLRCVEKTGSLRAAAMEMEMAYSVNAKLPFAITCAIYTVGIAAAMGYLLYSKKTAKR